MKRVLYALLLFSLVVLSGGCRRETDVDAPFDHTSSENMSNSQEQQAVYQRITAEQARAMMDEGDPYILLDVRTPEEFAERRIEGAILIPDYEIEDRVLDELPDKEALILIYCRSGNRSASTARKMIDMGYTNVYDFGGIIDWPYDTVTDN